MDKSYTRSPAEEMLSPGHGASEQEANSQVVHTERGELQ